MVKAGYKHKTTVPGTDAEYYVSRLLLMLRNLNGSNRPDLITPDGLYYPRFSLEVKSGKERKVVLNEDQFQYIFTAQEDYNLGWKDTFFEEQFSEGEQELLEKVRVYGKEDVELQVPLYYAAIARDDKLKASDLDRPFSSVRFNWGDIYMMPSEMVFHMFAVNRAVREKGLKARLGCVQKIENDMRGTIEAQLMGEYDYRTARSDSNFWQSLSLRALESFFVENKEMAFQEKGQLKYDLLHEVFPKLSSLGRFRVEGNRDSKISAFFLQEHENLFMGQINSVIEQRLYPLHNINSEREQARDLLQFLTLTYRERLFPTNITREVPKEYKHLILKDISPDQMNKLNRLTRWLAEGERSIQEQLTQHMAKNPDEPFLPIELGKHPLEGFVDPSVPF